MKNLIIASTSTVHGSSYLEYLLPTLNNHFKEVDRVLFIPYARASGLTHNEYTDVAQEGFNNIDIEVKGIHEYPDPIKAIAEAEAIFVGGGNTFVLTNELYKNNLIKPLQDAINSGTPYLGTSAGSNITGVNIKNTNDMPIVYPPSFNALGLIPFNINPHYLDPTPNSTHMGETRETRINEFHKFNTTPVVGLREGSWLKVKGDTITLQGEHTARVFRPNLSPDELESGELVSF